MVSCILHCIQATISTVRTTVAEFFLSLFLSPAISIPTAKNIFTLGLIIGVAQFTMSSSEKANIDHLGSVDIAEDAGESHHNEKISRQVVSELVEAEKSMTAWQAVRAYKRIMGYC